MKKLTKKQIIQKLSEENANMEGHIRFLYEAIDIQQEDKMKLEEENEFLKKQNEALKYLLKGLQ